MTAKVTPVSKEKSQGKQAKPKDKKKKTGRYKLILKGTWLKTPADWARFDAWAKVNALPRKIPQPEPISRTSKPLWKMKKRIDILSKPVEKPDSSHLYRPDLGVSKKALKAKASKRLKIIAKPVIKPSPIFREFPVIIKKSTLNYKATENIIKISKPKDYRTDECKILEEYVRKMEDELEGMEEENRKKNEKKLWVTLKRAMACPDLLTPGQINQLITEGGVYRTAFAYEFTPWMEFLSLPSYRFLKLRKDETAEKWREYILSEMETRGRRALEEQIKREEKKRMLEDEAAEEEEKAGNIEQVKKDPSKISKKDEKPPEDQFNEQSQGKTEETKIAEDGQEEAKEPEQNIENAEDGDEKTNEEEAPSEEVIQRNEDEDIDDKQESEVPEDQEKLGDGKSVKTVGLDGKPSTKSIKSEKKTKPIRVIPKLPPKEEDEESKKKRAERNAWRFEPPPWKEGDPLKVKKSALEGPGENFNNLDNSVWGAYFRCMRFSLSPQKPCFRNVISCRKSLLMCIENITLGGEDYLWHMISPATLPNLVDGAPMRESTFWQRRSNGHSLHYTVLVTESGNPRLLKILPPVTFS